MTVPLALDNHSIYRLAFRRTSIDEDEDQTFTGVLRSDFGKFFSIGDLNNDNYSDIVTGAWRYDNHQGRAWLYYGSPGDSTQFKFNWNTTNASPGKHTLKATISSFQRTFALTAAVLQWPDQRLTSSTWPGTKLAP